MKIFIQKPEETILNFVGINSSIKIIRKVNIQQKNMPDDLLNNKNSDKINKFVIHLQSKLNMMAGSLIE